jgi:hypothetical protein
MTEHQASRTLVKSPPELWAECSDAASLARHLGQFGEIRITRLEPETAVAWEGENASGTVRLEPSGWGTRVILTAHAADPAVAAAPAVAEVPEPDPPASTAPVSDPPSASDPPPVSDPPPAAVRRTGVFARLFGFLRRPPADSAPPAPAPADSRAPAPADSPPPAPAPADSPAPAPDSPAPAPDSTAPALAPAEAVQSPAPEGPATPEPVDPVDSEAALVLALDSLGQAHHRPFSRA